MAATSFAVAGFGAGTAPAAAQNRAQSDSARDVTFQEASGIQSEVAREEEAATPLSNALAGEPSWLRDVYRDMDYAYVWSGRFTRASSEFKEFERSLKRARERGVPYAEHTLMRLEDLRRADPETREIATSKLFAEVGRKLRHGVTSPDMDLPDDIWQSDRDDQMAEFLAAAYDRRNPASLIDEAVADNFIVERLLLALQRYRGFREEGGWEPISFEERKIELGASDDDIPLIRERLRAEGFFTGMPPEDPRLYDEAMESAIKSFQRSRSMSVDGIVGPNTIEALNESVDELIAKIELNIDRARWLPEELGERSVFVNIPDYTLRMLEGDRMVDSMPVVVGTYNNKTPAFADEMETVVINPYWNVPSSITIGEIAPAMLRDASYVARNDMEIITASGIVDPASVDWSRAAAGDPQFRVRQRPGTGNSLGQIKFLFPNQYAVYLHDTPSQSLFNEDRRAFSHGCIRVGDPLRLAEFVTQNTSDWNGARVEQAINSGQRIEFELDTHLPVYLSYFTAWVEQDGAIVFPRDIYDRDMRIAGELQQQT